MSPVPHSHAMAVLCAIVAAAQQRGGRHVPGATCLARVAGLSVDDTQRALTTLAKAQPRYFTAAVNGAGKVLALHDPTDRARRDAANWRGRP
jgi:hypothetical protein